VGQISLTQRLVPKLLEDMVTCRMIVDKSEVEGIDARCTAGERELESMRIWLDSLEGRKTLGAGCRRLRGE